MPPRFPVFSRVLLRLQLVGDDDAVLPLFVFERRLPPRSPKLTRATVHREHHVLGFYTPHALGVYLGAVSLLDERRRKVAQPPSLGAGSGGTGRRAHTVEATQLGLLGLIEQGTREGVQVADGRSLLTQVVLILFL